MITRLTGLGGLAQRGASSLAALFILIGFAMSLEAQQYCVSGAITSILNCDGCNFSVGDPVAMTFTVPSGGVTCAGTLECTASTTFSASIGGQSWTGNDTNTYGNMLVVSDSTINLSGSGDPSASNSEAADISLLADFVILGLPGNLLASGTLPAQLPSPDSVAASHAFLSFSAATEEGGPNFYFSYTGQNCAGGTPSFTAAGVVNAASFASGGVVPGEIATIFGSNLTTSTGINLTSTLPLAASFLNVSVTVNGTAAALFAVDNVNGQAQINFQVPWETKGTASIEVTDGTATSSPVSVPVLAAQPAIFNYSVGGKTFGAILHANFQLADTANPAKPGETVLIYCTGLGEVESSPADGAAGNGQSTLATPIVTIGGSPAVVSFSGLAPGFVGLYQVNAEVPTAAAAGNANVSMTISGGNSNSVLLPVN